MTARGYGAAAPIVDNATAEGKAKNRRIERKKQQKQCCGSGVIKAPGLYTLNVLPLELQRFFIA